MKVKMKITVKGSPDHIQVLEYKKGEVYELPTELANAFIRAKFALKYEEKAVKAAPENKAKVTKERKKKEKDKK